MPFPFEKFPKIARLSRASVVSEKIDGTNATVYVRALHPDLWAAEQPEGTAVEATVDTPPGVVVHRSEGAFLVAAASRKDWITPERDNHGFARWAYENAHELAALGEGWHRGEWWGSGVNRAYGLVNGEKRFSLFNSGKWRSVHEDEFAPQRSIVIDEAAYAPACCRVVPVLWTGTFDTYAVEAVAEGLREYGSVAAPGFARPEGVVVYHTAANLFLKKLCENDEVPKGAGGE